MHYGRRGFRTASSVKAESSFEDGMFKPRAVSFSSVLLPAKLTRRASKGRIRDEPGQYKHLQFIVLQLERGSFYFFWRLYFSSRAGWVATRLSHVQGGTIDQF
jgi:hypothetical protein